MPKEHKLSDTQKAQIVALEPHFSHAEISGQLNIQQSTVTKFIERFKNREYIENLLVDHENRLKREIVGLSVILNQRLVYPSTN